MVMVVVTVGGGIRRRTSGSGLMVGVVVGVVVVAVSDRIGRRTSGPGLGVVVVGGLVGLHVGFGGIGG